MTTDSEITRLRAEFQLEVARVSSESDLQSLRDKYLGRKNGAVTALMKSVAAAPPDRKPALGKLANELKQEIEQQLTERKTAVDAAKTPAGAVDITLPGRKPAIGHRHPLTIVREQIEAIFTRMGYQVLEGPELEDDYHNFEALNMPAEHPARDMQDTLYLDAAVPGLGRPATLLRTHTSPMQIRYMESHEPPVRIIVPGKVYRRDDLDLTHTPMFQQVEGLVVGEDITMADLKGTLTSFLHELFEDRTKVLFRPSFFPYTEPSAEVFIGCVFCGAKGCPVCKRTGWLEILGSGMVHPAVLEAVGYDADRYTGFAFGVGIERVAMLKYGVEDIRLFYENDLRFLEQFPPVKIVVSWLREFVDVTAPAQELGETLSLRGFELASIERSTIGDGRSTIDDAVLDFEITANRPDALSVLGLAREAATAYALPLTLPTRKRLPTTGTSDITVTLDAPDLCPRYAAAVVDVIIAPSPPWLAERLHAAGVRPINNVVDVTNYVLLEIGQPMHAFDLDRLAGRELRIRRADQGERIRTLDGTDRPLEPGMLVIADGDKAQAIAGIMGGGVSEVSAGTKVIVLESACFNPKSVRLTSKRLGLKTEASARFERGTDIEAPVAGLERAIALLEKIGAGQARGGVIDRYPNPSEARKLVLRRARIRQILGQEVSDGDVHRFLTSLGFELAPSAAGWHVVVPTFRVDVVREVDLIEEIGRHHGYDRLPTTFPALRIAPAPPAPQIERDRLVRRVLLAAGCSEALTFSFIDAALAGHFADSDAVVAIGNPLSAQFSVLRPSLVPGLLTSIAYNRNRGRTDACLFELGAAVVRTGESRRVAVAWSGDVGGDHWSGKRRPVGFFDIKGMVERVAEALRVELAFDGSTLPPYLSRGRSATIMAGGRTAGTLGMLTPAVVSSVGIAAGEEVYVAEIDLDTLSAAQSLVPLTATALPRFPSISRDISIVVDDTLPAATVRGTIRSVAPDTLVSVSEFDHYQGKGVPERRVSLSLRLTFRSLERTLTDAEVQKAMDAIIAALIKDHQAVQR